VNREQWNQVLHSANILADVGKTIAEIKEQTEEFSEDNQNLTAVLSSLAAAQRLLILTVARTKVTKE